MSSPARPALGSAALVALIAAILIPTMGGWQIVRARDATLEDARQTLQTLSHTLAQHAT